MKLVERDPLCVYIFDLFVYLFDSFVYLFDLFVYLFDLFVPGGKYSKPRKQIGRREMRRASRLRSP